VELKRGIVRTGALDVPTVRRAAEEAGYTTFVLPADGIRDRASFFDAVRNTLPLDPPVVSAHAWDALSDSLWEGLYQLPNKPVAILWPNARAMASASPSDFDIACQMLTYIVAELADTRLTAGQPKVVAVVVESAE
jgi:hypothetical protein